ncbi:4-alpha-glucanotransferase [Vreelandella neptunia]|uniref:4-alpha-glucanotransferase n=1 Tax=Vreelandella neptunia TaxID=115551 RepID=A0ABS9S8E0_9GAMM|nr:4-alpha-glucanotransferase [Halomonas neptunia]MCH4812381.1 4-alpha-glucanotransferase [Halomonas neptunia]
MKALLRELADAAGLLLEWENSDGEPCQLSEQVQRNLLEVLGYSTPSESAMEEGLQRLKRLNAPQSPAEWPPLLTADCGTPIMLPSPLSPGTAFTLQLEQGGSQKGYLDDDGAVPSVTEIGYHRLQIADTELTLAVAPHQCYSLSDASGESTPRMWGLAAQLYALRRPGDGGIGDTLALEQCVVHAAEQGADALAISPTHAMFSADPERYSPYSPSTRLLYNVLYSAAETLLGETCVHEAQARNGLQAELRRLEADDYLDWPEAARVKLSWLRYLYDDFMEREDYEAQALHQEMQAFRRAGGELLEDHCRFEALQRELGPGDWRDWPEELRDPASLTLAHFAETRTDEIGFHAFLQWLTADGLARAQRTARERGMAIGLITDLAVGADARGSQTWSRPTDMLEGVSIGAPPDLFNANGQDWGLAAFSPFGLKRSGFRSFIDMLRSAFAHAGGVRIDHILGLMRLWLIPQGAPPFEGGYLSYPLDDMLRLVALESWRHRAIVIGEDLGTVAPGFRERLTARGILGMQVLWFEQDEAHNYLPASNWKPNAIATTSTHDLPTVAGWWAGRDIEWRSHLGLLKETQSAESEQLARRQERAKLASSLGLLGATPTTETLEAADIPASQVLNACTRHLAGTPAPLLILPVEDALGLEEQANLPGTLDEHPNWRRRWASHANDLLTSDEVRQRLAALAHTRKAISQGKPSRSGQFGKSTHE